MILPDHLTEVQTFVPASVLDVGRNDEMDAFDGSNPMVGEEVSRGNPGDQDEM